MSDLHNLVGGHGPALIAPAGIVFFDEPAAGLKVAGIACVVFGIVVLNLQGAH
jgi:multidrug transporter EmrE-like cation transporter